MTLGAQADTWYRGTDSSRLISKGMIANLRFLDALSMIWSCSVMKEVELTGWEGETPTNRQPQFIWLVCLIVTYLTTLVACSEVPPSIQFSVHWSEPPTTEMWLWVRVEEGDLADPDRRVLSASKPVQFVSDQGLAIEVEDVPVGDNRIVVVEARTGSSIGLPIMFFGTSIPFSLSSGDIDRKIGEIVLERPDALEQEASASLLFADQVVERITFEQLRDATIQTETTLSVALMMTTDASFANDVVHYQYDSAESMINFECSQEERNGTEFTICEITGVDLAPGDESPDDGPYSVFIRFVDQFGYESETFTATVFLDTTPPVITAASVSPKQAKGNDVVTLQVNVNESLEYSVGNKVLSVVPLTESSPTFEGPVQIGDSLSYLWTASIDDKVADGSYIFKLSTEDMLGNVSDVFDVVDHDEKLVELTVDTSTIQVVNHTIQVRFLDSDGIWKETGLYAKDGSRIDVTVELDESPDDGVFELYAGNELVSNCTGNGLIYKCSLIIEAEGESAVSAIPIIIRVADASGNENSVFLAILTLDFEYPDFVVGPKLVRSDNFAPAMLSDTEIMATIDTEVLVEFTLSELPMEVPLLTVKDIVYEPAFGDITSLTFRYSVVADETFVEGPAEILVELKDLAGNAVSRSAGTITFDFTPFPPLTALEQDNIRMLRVPWGSSLTDGIATTRFEVCPANGEAWDWCPPNPVNPFSESMMANLFAGNLFESEVSCGDQIIGSLEFTGLEDGFWQDLLVDLPVVCVQRLDLAGNVSPPDPIQNYTWIATTIGETVENPELNPHGIVAVPHVELNLKQTGKEINQNELESVKDPDEQGLTVNYEGIWKQRNGQEAVPGELRQHAMAYDPIHDELVLNGGFSEACAADQFCGSWIFDGVEWRQVHAENDLPGRRTGHAMVYDAQMGRVLLVGGDDPENSGETDGATKDTWAWDGETWEDITPEGAQPRACRHSMAYDTKRGVVVLYGGGLCITEYSPDSDQLGTWEFDGSQWKKIEIEGDAPDVRYNSAMAYNQNIGKLLLYIPGKENTFDTDSQIWSWDGQSWELFPDSQSLAGRRDATLNEFGFSGECVLLGGWSGSMGCSLLPFQLTWDDGWEEDVFFPTPLARSKHATASDLVHQRIYLHGGNRKNCGGGGSNSYDMNDMWSFSELGWQELNYSEVWPSRRIHHHLHQHPDYPTQLWLYGGKRDIGNGATYDVDDIMIYRDGKWDVYDMYDSIPERRIYDASTAIPGVGVLFFGGLGQDSNGYFDNICSLDVEPFSDTWLWSKSKFSLVADSGNGPSARLGAAIAYDEARDRVVLFGGANQFDLFPASEYGKGLMNDTWEWDGQEWQKLSPQVSPSPRAFASLTYFSKLGKVVLYGGTRLCTTDQCELDDEPGEVWVWDGNNWASILTGNDSVPANRFGHAVVENPERGRLQLFYGKPSKYCSSSLTGSDVGYKDIWEWDGTTWDPVSPSGYVPTSRIHFAMAVDGRTGNSVMFGGDKIPFQSDSEKIFWFWDHDPQKKPGIQVVYEISEIGVPSAFLQEATVSAIASGSGYSADLNLADDGDLVGDHLPGTELQVWSAREGRWVIAAENESGTDEPLISTLSFTVSGAQEIQKLIQTTEQVMNLMVLPMFSSGNGPQPGQVVLDNIELQLDYKIPGD